MTEIDKLSNRICGLIGALPFVLEQDVLSERNFTLLREAFFVTSHEQFMAIESYVKQLDLCEGKVSGAEEIKELHAKALEMNQNGTLNDPSNEEVQRKKREMVERLARLREDMLVLRDLAAKAKERLGEHNLIHLFSASDLGLQRTELRNYLGMLLQHWHWHMAGKVAALKGELGTLPCGMVRQIMLYLPRSALPVIAATSTSPSGGRLRVQEATFNVAVLKGELGTPPYCLCQAMFDEIMPLSLSTDPEIAAVSTSPCRLRLLKVGTLELTPPPPPPHSRRLRLLYKTS